MLPMWTIIHQADYSARGNKRAVARFWPNRDRALWQCNSGRQAVEREERPTAPESEPKTRRQSSKISGVPQGYSVRLRRRTTMTQPKRTANAAHTTRIIVVSISASPLDQFPVEGHCHSAPDALLKIST